MPGRRVAVVGAGWAGLAAAVEAMRLGHAVTVFEMAPQPGGRARDLAHEGGTLDNGQHILIGAYTETLRLMRLVGAEPAALLHRTPLRLGDATGRGLYLPAGPAWWTFAVGVLRRRGWSAAERLALLVAAARWAAGRFDCAPEQTVADLAARLPPVVRRDLIDPLCVAALNTPAADASGRVFLRVLKDALFAGPGSSDLLLPRAGLGDLLPRPAWRWLAAQGAGLHAGRRVQELERDDHAGWCLAGERFDAVVLATPPGEAARLARPFAPTWADCASAFTYEPIVTVYVQVEGARLPEPMLALESDEHTRPAQFVFDRGALGGPAGQLAFVVSGAAPWVARGAEGTAEATLAQAREQLGAWLPRPARLLRTLTEKRATFRCTPGLLRPSACIAPGLFAAGDHVDGPYPATLEGAVRSGVAAARALPAPGTATPLP